MKQLISFILVAWILVACGGVATQTTDTGVTIDAEVDPILYRLELQIDEDPESYSQTEGSLHLYDTYARGIVWQDGKGLVRGTIVSLDPNVDFANVGETIIVKTTDRKVMAIQSGDRITLVCIADYEPVCAKSAESNTAAGECMENWEFDYCRLFGLETTIGR